MMVDGNRYIPDWTEDEVTNRYLDERGNYEYEDDSAEHSSEKQSVRTKRRTKEQ